MDKALLKDTLKDGIMGTWENVPLTQQTYGQAGKGRDRNPAKSNQMLKN